MTAHQDPVHPRQTLSSVKPLSMCPARPRELEGRLLWALPGPCKQEKYLGEASPPDCPRTTSGGQTCFGFQILLLLFFFVLTHPLYLNKLTLNRR